MKVRRDTAVLCILIVATFLVSSLLPFLAVDTLNGSQPAQRAHSLTVNVHTWSQSSGNLASTAANWNPASAPDTGDIVVFDSGSAVCTWDIAKTFSTFYMNATYTGTITQTVAFGMTGDFLVASGTLTGDSVHFITVGGDFIQTGGTISLYVLCLEMTGVSKYLTSSTAYYPKNLTFAGITNLTGTGVEVCKLLTVSGTVNLETSLTIDLPQAYDMPTVNLVTVGGTITGPSFFVLNCRAGATITPDLSGTLSMDLGLHIYEGAAQTTNTTVKLSNDLTTTLVSLASDHPDAYMTFDLNGYDLTAIDIIVEPNGIINGSNSVITVSHLWSSEDGAFIPGTSIIVTSSITEINAISSVTLSSGGVKHLTILPNANQYMNVTGLTLGTSTIWNVNSTGTVSFTLSGLESGRMYKVYIDGVQTHLLTASDGTISFTYSGPWSEHQFEIIATSITGAISPLVNLIFIMFAIGVVVGVMGETVITLRKEKIPKVETLVNMVIYIIIGVASLGILYSIVT